MARELQNEMKYSAQNNRLVKESFLHKLAASRPTFIIVIVIKAIIKRTKSYSSNITVLLSLKD